MKPGELRWLRGQLAQQIKSRQCAVASARRQVDDQGDAAEALARAHERAQAAYEEALYRAGEEAPAAKGDERAAE